MKITIDIDKLKDSDNTWSESTAKALEHLTGKKFKDVISEAKEMENAKPDIPEGKPSEWRTLNKTKFITDHGIDEFKRVVQERE